MSLKVGIDFGTSNSGVAIYDGQQVRLLPVDPKNVQPEVIKTVLYITKEYRAYLGQEATEAYYRDNVNRQRRFVKQWAGEIDYRGADMHYVRDIYVYVDELKPGRLLQYLKTALRKEGYRGTKIFERYYTPGDLAKTYLTLLKDRAEDVLGESIDAVTLGRPVKFSEAPEQDKKAEATLRQAASEAGFKEIDFELEPIAAALYYEQSISKPQNVIIFDFGGGTLDIAVMRLGNAKNRKIYASGGVDIAGSDFDRTIIEKRMLPHFGYGRVKHHPEILEMIHAIPDWMALPELGTPINRTVLQKAIHAKIAPVRLKALEELIYNDLAFTFYNRVEAGKIALSKAGATVINLEDKNIALWEMYTRYQFEADIKHYLNEVEKVLLDTLAKSGLEVNQIDAVVKTGGSSNIPLFTNMLARLFGKDKVKESNAMSSVVGGLAIKARM
ncbi:MAG: Hsp70 family protein [Anaerolineales bacterium]|nr:Hsp70 family protein [Anaerolineales bacterium]MCZ2122711.1 Hsp70 family protein [Anaerolineales bacterium]